MSEQPDHQCNYPAEHCELCHQAAKPALPTKNPERPDVEGIRATAKNDLERISGPHPTAIAAIATISLCDHIDALKAERVDCHTYCSPLAGLVKAGQKYGYSHWRWCAKSEDVWAYCTCGYDDLTTALEAAKVRMAEKHTVPN